LVFVFSVFILIGLTLISKSNKKILNNSIDNLIKQNNVSNYYVLEKVYGSSLTDLSGEWWIYLNQPSEINEMLKSKFIVADEADSIYFKGLIEKIFFKSIQLSSNYKLYRADVLLGKDTICEYTPCGTYILYLKGNNNLFVGIYKN
jgi:hypothetical protein